MASFIMDDNTIEGPDPVQEIRNPLRDIIKPMDKKEKSVLSQPFWDGVMVHVHVAAGINSLGFKEGACTSPRTCGFISQLLTYAPGDYIETGTRYGGSALVAAIFAKSVVTIDPAYEAEFNMVMEKVLKPQREKITRIGKRSDEVKRLPKRNYTVGFIDGSHEHEDVIKDFELMRNKVSDYLIFDDVDLPGVYKTVTQVAEFVKEWTLVVFLYPTTAVFAKHPDSKLALGLF